jgi:hypothetical protein
MKPNNIFYDKNNIKCTFKNFNHKFKRWWTFSITTNETGKPKCTKSKWSDSRAKSRKEWKAKNSITAKESSPSKGSSNNKKISFNFRLPIFVISSLFTKQNKMIQLDCSNIKKSTIQAFNCQFLAFKTILKAVWSPQLFTLWTLSKKSNIKCTKISALLEILQP